MNKPLIVAGVDVGGTKKGFHAIALEDDAYLAQCSSTSAAEVAAWCQQIGAVCVGVDAPCQWSTGGARACERALAQDRISSFITPTRANAEQNTTGFYGWMFNGEKSFAALSAHYVLFNGTFGGLCRPLCFETFPQAIAGRLAGKSVSAKQKGRVRRELLQRAGLDIGALTNIDKVDAALCALAAHRFLLGDFKPYGESATGFIIVPASAL